MKTIRVTEWEWFKIQLRLHALEYSAQMFGERYEFNATVPNIGNPAKKVSAQVVCSIYGKQVQNMIENGASRKEQLEYYTDWVEGQKQVIAKILEGLPDLRSTLNVNADVAFVMVYNYGMGGSPVCTFMNGAVHWSAAATSFVVRKRIRQRK